MENPAKEINRRKLSKEKVIVPTKEQFRELLETMRKNNGKDSADLVEFLGYSGCRLAEVVGDSGHGKPPMLWGDVNFDLKTFTVAWQGHRRGWQEPHSATIPPAGAITAHAKGQTADTHRRRRRIFQIESAMTSIINACRKLGINRITRTTPCGIFLFQLLLRQALISK